MNTREKPILVFDGDCEFCQFWIARWRDIIGSRVEIAPYQHVASSFPEIPLDRFRESVVLIDETGVACHGARAVLGALAHAPRRTWLLSLYEHVSGVRWLAEVAYRFVARNRRRFWALTKLMWGRQPEVAEYVLVHWVFLRALALIYLCAFLSLWVQVHGLIGSAGILPAGDYLQAVARLLGPDRYWQVPILAWLNSGDTALHVFCGAGCILSLVALVGWFEGPAFLLLWVLYLSLVQIGQEFLGFQWDNLLLETGLLATVYASWSWRSNLGSGSSAHRIARWLLLILLFKLMLMSGLAKLQSADRTWRDLSALNYHYWTQPLPTWIGWYFALLPPWFHKLSVIIMFLLELIVPFLIFLPRRPRLFAFWGLVFLQVMILLTGNYGIFNWLTLALCLLLLDDLTLSWLRHVKFNSAIMRSNHSGSGAKYKLALLTSYGLIFALLSGAQIVDGFGSRDRASSTLSVLERWLDPLRSINRYGLFSVMTIHRQEIIIEGSDDDQHWIPYEFKWKPGSLITRPAFVAPHMPRLDWQMWFAALDTRGQERWFSALLRRLLENSPAVTRLFAVNPFPDHPPRYIRAMLYEYAIAVKASQRAGDRWWQCELVGVYAPASSL